MKTAAITLLSALLVVSFHEGLSSLVGRHELRKREVDCSVGPDIGGPHDTDRCCTKAIGLIDGVYGENEEPEAHHSPTENSTWDVVAHGPSELGEHEEWIRCLVEEKLQNVSLLSDGRLNETALTERIAELLTPNATAWTHEKVHEIVSGCVATAEQGISGVTTNCSSGAAEWIMCLNRKIIVECPSDYWEQSDQCNSLKGYYVACPSDPSLTSLLAMHSPTQGVQMYGFWDKVKKGLKETLKKVAKEAAKEAGKQVLKEVLKKKNQ
ncbi:uncharacterized protein LOC134540761 [Bacillus rossius redtenbacheri]|uniref:uncharacterized protein LOC134540761 n=1 Tax=Bacillus rossius redtenbacheri TaxID=93214 RepID=UPI002FDD78FF